MFFFKVKIVKNYKENERNVKGKKNNMNDGLGQPPPHTMELVNQSVLTVPLIEFIFRKK